jgi:transposase
MPHQRSYEPAPSGASSTRLQPVPLLARESLYVGVDIGKRRHVAGFVSRTLLERHGRFEGCPALAFDNTRDGFRALVERLEAYTPLEQVFVLMEKTGHYHKALLQYLLDLDVAVHLIHVQERTAGLLKTDKRDALGLANQLYNQLELGAQVADQSRLVRRAVPPSAAAALLRGLVRHRYELVHEATQRKNKLTAICDELFPEFADLFKDPNAAGALAVREAFPTPHAIATATLGDLVALRVGHHPSAAKLCQLQAAAATSIGTHDLGRQRGLVLEQRQLIRELQLLQAHIAELEVEIGGIVATSREGRILTSIPVIGPLQAAAIIAAIGHIDNFASAAALRAYCGWAPQVTRSGETQDEVQLTRGGTRTMKATLYLVAANAIQQPDCEWARLYARLVPLKCSFDARRQRYVGKNKVLARIAGQLVSTIYALLKRDAELFARCAPGRPLPEPVLYDPAVHRAHREGHYRASKPRPARSVITVLPVRADT